MRIPDRTFIGTWIKKDGKLTFKIKEQEALFQKHVNDLREGQMVAFMVEFAKDDGRLMQIAKVKASIRAISKETGETFINAQNSVKKEAGLYNEITQEYVSFANASSEQLSSAIQICIERGDFIGIQLR